jgi:hypothetical protein
MNIISNKGAMAMTVNRILELIDEAKHLHINDPNMIASWIYNRKDGKKYYTCKELKGMVKQIEA